MNREKKLARSRRDIIIIVGCTLLALIGGHVWTRGFGGHMWFQNFGTSSSASVNEKVLAYEPLIEKYANEYHISDYVSVIEAIMQQESSGEGTDVMQCSECPFNTEYDNTPNAIDDPEYSIQVGAEYFAYCLKEAGCKRISNTERLKIALQDYNFGNSYAIWVLENYGSYSVENATEFSLMMQNTLGWSSYGDPEYVDHVLRYFIMP